MRDAEMELVFLSKITLMTVSKFKPISDHIAIMKIRGKYNNMVIMQAYAPTSKYADEDFENFHCELQNVINCMSDRDIGLINGGMNCKVGGLCIKEPNFVGKHNNIDHGYNDRGKTIVSFYKQNSLSIANTQFKHHLYVWISPGK